MNPILSADVVCRRVGLNRTDDLLNLENSCFFCDRIRRRNLRNLLRSPSAYCLGAYRAGELVGSMVVLFRRNSRVGRIYSIAILPAFRGMGLAQKLLARAEREARARRCSRMRLEVRMDNIPAIRLYEKLGFESVQVLSGYYEDGTHGMVYRKELVL
jgi:ribosomal protein S18 acetylase RimI-like enzyme